MTTRPAAQETLRARCCHPRAGVPSLLCADPAQTVHARFAEVVRAEPARLALRDGGHDWSYGDLDRAANRIAQRILDQCGEGEQPVALLLPHNATMVQAALGVWKAGKIQVPVDPSYPRDRIAYMLRDCGAGLIICSAATRAMARELVRDHAVLLDLDVDCTKGTDQDPGIFVSPDAISYILYTSGSTGQPKGVFQNHRGQLWDARHWTQSCGVSPADRLLLLTSYTQLGMQLTTVALCNGASLLPYEVARLGVGSLPAWVQAQGITIFRSTSTLFRHFVGALQPRDSFDSLRLIRLGGEPVTRRDAAALTRFAPGCVMMNALATTETGAITEFLFDRDTPLPEQAVPVGYPVDSSEVMLLTEDGKPAATGDAGEIMVRSRWLAQGYWLHPDQTAARFLPDPDGGDARIYRTGDLGRWRSDGALEHLGRCDFQVKIRGHRVEPEEIERALLDLEGIAQAAVAAHPNAAGEAQLVAYVVPRHRPGPSPATLTQALAQRLPAALLPARYVELAALPQTPNGKTDRRALPPPGRERPTLDVGYAAPRTAAERTLAKIWSEVLGLAPVGVRDPFVELGGNSLLASQIVTRVRNEFRVDLAPRVLLEAPTIASMARVLRGGPARATPLVQLRSGGAAPALFCIPPFKGTNLIFGALARHLEGDHPVFGLEPLGVDGEQEPPTRVEAIAAQYLEVVRTVQPHGPYHFAGKCFGGIVAWEMAQQLRRLGESVGLLALLDVLRPPRLEELGPEPIEPIGRRHRLWMALQTLWFHWRFHRHNPWLRDVAVAEGEARSSYGAQPYPGPVALFLVRDGRSASEVRSLWEPLVRGPLDLAYAPGSHRSMMYEPHVRTLAAQLRRCLAQASVKSTHRGASAELELRQ